MLNIKFPKLIVLFAAMLFASAAVFAQDGPPPDRPKEARFGQAGQPSDDMRPNILQELGLSREQFQAVRRLNVDRKPVEQAARQRFQEANRALNMAIYADSIDDSDFKSRLSEFQTAQAELARIKFSNELAIRKLLTREQLVRFRDIRRRFAEARENSTPQAPGVRPALRQLRRGNRLPGN
ncbi:MAG: hypothetical protein HOP17_13170 [Acidobacteria bacterium]|nr:hypothetical protein [Acidobacteriota bacterium]